MYPYFRVCLVTDSYSSVSCCYKVKCAAKLQINTLVEKAGMYLWNKLGGFYLN